MKFDAYIRIHTKTHEEFELLKPLMSIQSILKLHAPEIVCDVGRIKLDDESEISVYSPNYQTSLPLF